MILQPLVKEGSFISKKPKIKIFEAFAGVGAQRMALAKLKTLKVKTSAISEWFIDAIIAYWLIHHNGRKVIKNPTDKEMLEQFHKLHLSKNSKTPWKASLTEIAKKREKYINLFNANLVCNNFGSISNHSNWAFHEKKKYLSKLDFFTYSFPCQDISTAGKMKGLEEGTGTTSSLLWEVKSLLNDLKACNFSLPKVLVMENVKVVDSAKFSNGLMLFKRDLESLGYENFSFHLNANHFGSLQERKRFFMVSIKKSLGSNKVSELLLKHHLEMMKRSPSKKLSLRKIVGDIRLLPLSPKNSVYESQFLRLYGHLENKERKQLLKKKLSNFDEAYASFYQAKIIVGLDALKVPTITFKGEFSRIRVFDFIDGKPIVRRLTGPQNWRLMGFEEKSLKILQNNEFEPDQIASLAGNSITLQPLVAIFTAVTNIGALHD